MCAENYKVFADFKRYVLDKGINEINIFTDLKVSYKPIKTGKEHKTTEVVFYIHKKKLDDKMTAYYETVERVNKRNGQVKGQISIFDYDMEKEMQHNNNPITITMG